MKLHSNIMGSGEPIVILHGFLGMGDNWKSIGSMLSEKDYEVHLLDQRNHGRSPHSEDFSYELMAEDLVEYTKQHQLDKVVMIGHSMGGKTAMTAACSFPEICSKLIVVDIAPKYYPPHHQEILAALTALEKNDFDSRNEAEEFLSSYIDDSGVKLFLLKNLYRKSKGGYGLRLNLEALKNNIEEIGQALPESAVFQGPSLFIKGERSGYIDLDRDEVLLKKHFPDSKTVVIADAGHWVHAEKKDAFFKAVLNFL